MLIHKKPENIQNVVMLFIKNKGLHVNNWNLEKIHKVKLPGQFGLI